MLPINDSEKTNIFPFWTVVIIAANVLVFYLQLTSSNQEAFISQYALIPSNVDFSNWQTLLPFFTSQFLHGGFLHIISNMLFLWVFGDNVEERFGFILYPIIYLMSGFVGGLSQYVLSPNADIPMIGASGAVAGILGAYFAWFPRHTIKTLITIPPIITFANVPAFFMLFYWIITQIFAGIISLPSSADMGGVAYFAHIGGFAFGFLAAKLIPTKRRNVLVPA